MRSPLTRLFTKPLTLVVGTVCHNYWVWARSRNAPEIGILRGESTSLQWIFLTKVQWRGERILWRHYGLPIYSVLHWQLGSWSDYCPLGWHVISALPTRVRPSLQDKVTIEWIEKSSPALAPKSGVPGSSHLCPETNGISYIKSHWPLSTWQASSTILFCAQLCLHFECWWLIT